MVESFFKYFIGFYVFVKCQYNFNLHFELHFPNLPNYSCPEYHVYALGLFPHTCVSYHNKCLGATQVEVRKYIDDQLLCHPNFQVNFTSNGRVHKNFYVDPKSTISLSINTSGQFLYTSDINLPNCFIAYIWYTVNGNKKSYQCLYYHSAYSLGNQSFADFSLIETIKYLYSYGRYDEFTAIQCPNKDCDGCSFSSDLTSYNCTSCFGDRYIYGDTKDCSLVCPIIGGLCDEQNPIPTKCRRGFKKVLTGTTTFRCDICSDENCLNCDSSTCSECQVRLWSNDYFSITTISNSFNICQDLDNCIEYYQVAKNLLLYDQRCSQAIIGYMIQDQINILCKNYFDFQACQSIVALPNCYHCSNNSTCLVCNVGYYLNNGACVQQTICSVSCKTCMADDPNFCTSCYLEKYLYNGICVCEEICLTCSNQHGCLTCNPLQFRQLDGARCICQNGYYDSGNLHYICSKCHTTCLTCDGGDLSNCITCDSQQNRHFVKGQCICNQGFGEFDLLYSNKVCQLCHKSCRLCVIANDPSSCTACLTDQNRYLTENYSCPCLDKYNDDGGTLDTCYGCHFSCGSCDGTSSTNCIKCDLSSHRSLINQACVCQKGYYENSFQLTTCPSCHYSCIDCQANSSIDRCIECPSTRVPDVIGTTFSCVCKDSNYFDDGVSLQCQKCHYSCLTCTYYGLTFCSTCDLTIRKYSNDKCLCLPKMYDDGISTCLSCHYSCLICSGPLSTNCLTCSSDVELRQLKTGQCICLDGYFEDNGQVVCSKCFYRCKTCSITKDQCLTCVDNSFRDLGIDSSCSCFSGYYDNGNPVCQFCNFKCNSCLGPEENQCIDCKPLSNRYFSDNRCLCLSHYYELGTEQCSACSSNCLECENTYDNCTSCESDKILIGNKCLCPSKLLGSLFSTYQAGGSTYCIRCHYSCLTCFGTTKSKCSDCYATESRYLSGSNCLCNEGYFDAGVSICQKCGHSCLSCVNSLSQCLSCQINSLRTLNIQGKACICQNGYYDDGSNPICQICNYSCYSCVIQLNHCTDCLNNAFRYFNDQLFTCDCKPGYYDSGQVICQPCHYSCYECTGPSNQECKSCKSFDPTSKRIFFNGKCICQIGYYDDGSLSNCQSCAITCEVCENQPNNCTACSTTRSFSNSKCECLYGYYENDQKECGKCDENCLQCKNKPSNCISCDSNNFRTLDQQTNSCICQSNYLELNGLCQQCYGSCLNCLDTLSRCSSCEPNKYLSNGQCFCLDGYFDNQGNCQTCHKSCLTCQDNEAFCLSCSILDLRKLTINNTCVCIDGYFDYLPTITCLKCDPSCKTCSLNSLNCQSCYAILNLDLLGNKCVCKQGYYLDSLSKTCLQCHISCLGCTQYQICTSCQLSTRIFDGDLNKCVCQQGYFEANQADCLKCNYQCQTCEIAQDNCLSCHPLVNRILQGNICQCLQGFFDAGIEMCFPCDGVCKACQNTPKNCTLCYELEQRRLLVDNSCICQTGYFDNGFNICQQCSLKCKTCVGSAEYCISCDTNQKRLDQSTFHKCPCVQGYYDDEQNICQKCHIKCEGCLNSRDNCLNCRSSSNSNRYLLSNQCNCKPGFYDNDIQLECQKCSIRCKTCVGNALNCLTCYDNLRINPPACKCLDGYYEDQSQLCLKCSSKCLTCETNESNCLSCQIERINNTCDCQQGYFDSGLENCLTCGFQCLGCTQTFTNCTSCKGDRVQAPYCKCADGYYDDGLNQNCQVCNFSCTTCNTEGCLACNGNRILSNENTCDPPQNSFCYDTTPWCSDCEVAVLVIRFSDDLNFVLIKFYFQLKKIQQAKTCNEILYDDTINKLGVGYSCDIDESDPTILKINLGQEPTLIVGDQVQLKSNVLSHIDCQNKLTRFIFDTVLEPLNYLLPIIQFKTPNYQVASCIDNYIFSDSTQNDGKRQFAYVNWSYQIINKENDPSLDDFITSLNTQQTIDLIIPAKTLPQNSSIIFSIDLYNFLGSQSTFSFNLNTQLDSQPIIQVDVKSSYYIYEDINIAFSVSIINCRGNGGTSNSLFQIYLTEINRSISTAKSSNVSYSIQSNDTSYSVKISKYSLTPNVIYGFNLSTTDVNSKQSSYLQFSFKIKMAGILCQFENAVTVQSYREDLNLIIQCKDLNANSNWNTDSELQIQVSCIDLFTSQQCKNLKNETIKVYPTEYSQIVPKYSMNPFSAQSWQVIATKGNLTSTISHVIVYLEASFLPLSVKYHPAYSVRPINNYELLNFTYDVQLENRQNIVEMAVEIIQDYVVMAISQIKYYELDFTFQDLLGSTPIVSTNYSFRFSVQYSTNINPSYFNLPVQLNIPPICQRFKQIQSNSSSLTQLEITPICSKSDDSPYQYKFGYFLSASDMQQYISGDKNLIMGETVYQISPKLTQIVPNSFLNQQILFLVSIIDQGGSITNMYGKAEIGNQFNCTFVNSQNSTSLKPNMLFNQFIQSSGQAGQDCIQLKEKKLQELYSKVDFSSQELNILLKALKISKSQQSIAQTEQRRVLDELTYQQCYDSEKDSFSINYTSNESKNKTSILNQIEIEMSNFETALSFFTIQHDQLKQLLQNQTFEWDQKLNDEFDLIQASLRLLYLLPDNIVSQYSTLSAIDEQIYANCNIFLNLIQNLSLLVQESAKINGNQLSMVGEMITWQLIRQSTDQLLGISVVLQDQVIKFSQKEQIKIKLNSFKFSNQIMENIKKQFNFTQVFIDPELMIQTQLKNFLINGKEIIQNTIENNYGIGIKQLSICTTQSKYYQQNNLKALCVLLSLNNSISQCSVEIVQQDKQTLINCNCQEFGYIFLVYYQELNNNTNNSISFEDVISRNSLIFSLNIQSTTFYCFLGYIVVVNIILLLLIIYERNQQQQEENIIYAQPQDITKLQIKSYPGNYKIIKENFKFLHQLTQFCYNSGSLVKNSFYFLDINIQICFMLLIIYVIDLESDNENQYFIEIILVVSFGVAYRFISKIFQGFVRINNTLKIVFYVFLEFIFIIQYLFIIVEVNIQNSNKSEQKLFNWLIGIVIYEIFVESILIVFSVYTYKLAFKSISFKEFKLINHLVYYFAYQEKLEKIFRQCVIL